MINVRIFISSPNDVTDERIIASQVIEGLQYDPDLRNAVTLEVVAWDKKGSDTPLLAIMPPQEAINEGLPKPSECDIVIVIFWARMGTPLPTQSFSKPDGSRFLSGTEWEFEDAMQAYRKYGKPTVIVYKRTEDVAFNPKDHDFDDQVKQWRRVEAFFENFYDQDGSAKHGYNKYKAPDDFRSILTEHLRSIVQREIKSQNDNNKDIKGNERPALWKGSPFPGLRSFTYEDALIFFGREIEIDNLVKRLDTKNRHLICIVGASGSGKSSLVAAGLLPRLMSGAIGGSQDWLSIRFSPGEFSGGDPFEAFAKSLMKYFPDTQNADHTFRNIVTELNNYSPDLFDSLLADQVPWSKLFIFIDQFEELFTLVKEQHRTKFITLLGYMKDQVRVRIVLTLRSDFYARCLEFPKLAEILKETTYPLAAPLVHELKDMITKPAQRAGLDFEDELVTRLLRDTGSDTGSLALMAFALQQLYEARNKMGVLTHQAYESFGGVKGAIGRQAQSAFSKLSKQAKNALPKLFTHLVSIDERSIITRRPANEDLLPDDEYTNELITEFTEARLLVRSKRNDSTPIIEVAHEALFGEWKHLHDWLVATEQFLKFKQRLDIDTQDWLQHKANIAFLYRGTRLEEARVWLQSDPLTFSPENHHFIKESWQHHLDQIEEQESLLLALDHRSKLLKAVVDVSLEINSTSRLTAGSHDISNFYDTVAKTIKGAFSLYYVGIFLIDQTNRTAILKAGTGEEGQQMLSAKHNLPIDKNSMIGSCIVEQKARIALDVGAESIRFDNPYLPLTRSEMALPLFIRQMTLGALTIQSTREADFQDDDVSILESLADQLGIAIDNIRLLKQIEKHDRQFHIVKEIIRLAVSSNGRKEALNSIVDLVRQRLDLYYVGIFVLDRNRNTAVLTAGTGLAGKAMITADYALEVNENSMIGWCISNTSPRIANDISKDSVRLNNDYLPETRSEMAIPLMYKDGCIGALTIQSKMLSSFSEEDISVLQSTTDQVAMIIGGNIV